MRQTRTDSPSLIKHRPIDSSCVGIESEDLPYGSWEFDRELESDMICMSPKDLKLHHPEFDFGIIRGSKRPKGYDYVVRLPGSWRTANWRHTGPAV